MLKFWNNICKPNSEVSFSKTLLHTGLIIIVGMVLGVVAKLLDIYTSYLGNLFSQMSVWIFLCTLLAVYSSTPVRAAANVLFFCVGMLGTYHLTAELTASVYSTLFLHGWTVFALFTPAMGFCAWYAKGSGLLAKFIAGSIILVLLVAAVVLFDRIRISDIVFALLIGIVLFKK